VWEYAENGFRPPDYLAGDLGAIVRFVAVNLLFTTSPGFDPMAYEPAARQALQLHTTIFEGNPEIDGDALTNTPAAAAILKTLKPWLRVKSSSKDVTPTPAALTSAVQSFQFGTPQPPGCWQDYGFPAAQLICTLQEQQPTYLPQVGNDMLIPSYTFTHKQDEFGQIVGLAVDNLVDGKPAAAYQFLWPDILAYGLGNTLNTSHEVGHLLGAAHPHDGFDPTCGCPYQATGGTFFSWIGDQSETLMSYAYGMAQQFSVFDKDNIARNVYAGYLANTEPASQQTFAQRRLLKGAKIAFNSWQFQTAAELARQAWERGAATMTAGTTMAARTARSAAPAAAKPGQPDFVDHERQRVDLGQVGQGSVTTRPGAQAPTRGPSR